MKAIKKPVQIDYLPFTEFPDLIMWCKDLGMSNADFNKWFDIDDEGKVFVKTLEGTSYQITTNDYIVRGVKGEFYPCKSDIFLLTHDLID